MQDFAFYASDDADPLTVSWYVILVSLLLSLNCSHVLRKMKILSFSETLPSPLTTKEIWLVSVHQLLSNSSFASVMIMCRMMIMWLAVEPMISQTSCSKLQTCSNCRSKKRSDKKAWHTLTLLLNLPCYDTVQFPIVDPMHNLLLGSAKSFISRLKINHILEFRDFTRIQAMIDRFTVPAGIGRLVQKGESGFLVWRQKSETTGNFCFLLYV